MPASSAVTCKVNKVYKNAVKSSRFVKQDVRLRGHYSVLTRTVLWDTVLKETSTQFSVPGMKCCGMEELDFQPLAINWQNYANDWTLFRTWIANYIHYCFPERDRRVVFAGLPIKRPSGLPTMYNFAMYQMIRTALNELGFVELAKPYVNKNSGNQLVVLAGQL